MAMKQTILLLSAILLVSCRQPEAPAEDVSPGEAPQAARADAGERGGPTEAEMAGQPEFELNARDKTPTDASIVRVGLSNQGNPESGVIGAETAKFKPTDTVYASIETNAKQGGYTLYAKWVAVDGSVLSEYGTRVADGGMQRTVVSLSKPDGWTSGDYKIELAINSQQGRNVGFQVQ